MPRSWLKAAGPVLVAAGLAPMAVAGGSLGIANATHNASAVVYTPAEATIIDLQHGLAASQTHGAHGLFQNVYLLAYLSGAASFWLTTGGFFYLQVVSDYFRPAWAPRGKHGIDSWRTAFRKAAWNLHVSLPSFVLFCAVVSFKAFEYCGIDAPSNVRWVGGTWAQMAGTMAVMAFVDDLVFWTAHWGLHASPYLFKNIHALHHRYHNPIAPAVFYTHPIDFIASYATEFWVGPLLVYLGVLDVFTVCSYNFMGVAGAVMIHAGVQLNVPFTKCDVASFHSFHHKMGDSHYGVWGMVDYLFGTCVDFDRLDSGAQPYHSTIAKMR